MPMALMHDVPFSTVGDPIHHGPNQAGNKSLLSFRADIGVPGYTGFISAPHQVVLPIKHGVRTGKPVDTVTKDATTLATVAKGKVSEYIAAYHKSPGDTLPFSKSGGGYWITQRKLPDSPPFIAATTYQSEILNSQETAEKQLTRSLGLRCTLPQYEAARMTAPRAQSADPSVRRSGILPPSNSGPLKATQRPATAVTTYGELVGYQTTSGSTFVQNPLTGGGAAPGAAWLASLSPKPPADKSNGETRYPVMPAAMAPGMYGAASAYRKDFGEECSDPMERAAPSERFQSRMTTGRDLAAGSTRATNNPPGYTGHIAASKYNALAQAQSHAPDERLNRHADMLLYTCDQFSRTRLPGYTGYKPQAARNITLEQPSQGPPTNTTTGAANLQATKHGVPHVDTTHHTNSKAGLMTFFDTSGQFVSDNGLANAQAYYKLARPDGAPFKFAKGVAMGHR